MTYPIVYALARNCVASPLNVRTESDSDADAELEAMIGQAGFVLQNLIGTAIKRKKDSYSIFGGGRRLARVHGTNLGPAEALHPRRPRPSAESP